MSNHQEDLESAIIKWISTFEDLPEHPQNFESLADGIILMDIMNKISPEAFDLSKINKDACENWALRHHNLTYLYDRLERFYIDALKLPFDKGYVDCLKISKNNDREHLCNLIEVVIGAAIQCEDKEKYINAILSLDEFCQNELMLLIEKALNRSQAEKPTGETASNVDSSFDLLAKGSPSKMNLHFGKGEYQEKKLLTKIEELENENQQLNHKLTDLTQEKESLKIKLAELTQEIGRKNQEIRHLMADRDKALEKLTTHDSQEELEKEVKLRDRKIDELERFIEELKQKHEADLSNLQDEINASRRKIAELSKLEGTMDFYKQKYDEYTKLSVRVSDLDVQVEELRTELDEVNETNRGLLNKIEVYKEKLEVEKTKNISMDIDATKKKAEIDSLKSEKKRLEFINSELEGKINDLNKFLERVQREQQDSARHHRSTDRALNKITGQDFTELMRGLERENEVLRSGKKGNISMVEDGEKEILEKENEILKAKCIEIQTENESMKDQVAKSRDVQVMERLLKENASLKEDIEKLKKKVPSPRMKMMENSRYEDEIRCLRKQLNEHEESIIRVKELEDEVDIREGTIKDLNNEIDALKNVIDEMEDQKLTELRLLGSALQELALRNVNLESQIKSLKEQGNSYKMNPLTQLNPNITPINYNIRR